jgi:gluconate 5-dehydrogenase
MTEARTIAVLGAAGGIGTSVTRRLAELGHTVVAVGRTEESLRQLTGPDRSRSLDITGFVMDLSGLVDGDDLVAFALATSGRFDGLVNTAAVYEPTGATVLDLIGWERTMGTNLRGPILVASAAARHFTRQGTGRIVQVTSITASVSRGGYTMYEASKAGLAATTRSMAVELASSGVLVNAVAPGWVRTPMTEGFLAGCSQEAIADLIPVGRVGEADEIAQVACWLALDSPGFLTGQTIVVDGGQTARTGHL